MSRFSLASAALVAVLLTAGGPAAAQSSDQGGDDPADIVATQIRSQGYACDAPSNARQDTLDTSPGELAWILDCGNATYRVKLVPDQAAIVERMD